MAGENILVVENNATLLRVVESALVRADFHVASAADPESSLALARSSEPALILIDSVLSPLLRGAPDPEAMAATSTEGGVGLCRALVADAALAKIPVVLMVGKEEDVDAEYAGTPNVVDYLTKPFSPGALLTMVEQVIGKTGAAGAARPSTAATAVTTTAAVTVRADGGAVAPSRAIAIRGSALSRLREAIALRVERFGQEEAQPGAGDATARRTVVAAALSDDVLAALLAENGFVTRAAARAEGDTESERPTADLAGQLSAVSVSEVLSLLAQQGQTGTLRISIGDARVELFFRSGRVELAAAAGIAEEFLLGRFAVAGGFIPGDVLATVLAERAQSQTQPPLLGRDLIARALLTAEQLRLAMERQTAELIYECLRWSSGRFQFHNGDSLPAVADDAALALSVDTLLLEGFRRVDEWRLIERDIHSFDLVFVREDVRIAALAPGTLTREEIAVLDALTGKRSVRDVVRALRMGSFDVTRILYRLRRAQLIRQRVEAIASH